VGPVLVPLLEPLDFLLTMCWAHKRGQCWFPCWVLLDLLLIRWWAHKRGQCWFPYWVLFDRLLTRWWALNGSMLVPLLGYYWTCC
jgi:hypothetical protein